MASKLLSKLRSRATSWASQISRKANSTAGKPAHVRVSSSANINGGNVEIKSVAVSPKGDARAYEYGSGIHSRRSKKSRYQLGAKGKILITPKRKKVLAFFWDKLDAPPGTTYNGKKLIKIAGDGRALFRYVEHPGVMAAGGGKGYLGPAITEVRKRIRKELPAEVSREIIGEFKMSFKKKG